MLFGTYSLSFFLLLQEIVPRNEAMGREREPNTGRLDRKMEEQQ